VKGPQKQDDDLLRQQFSNALWLPLRSSIQFDPREVRQWDLGTFYRTLSIESAEYHVMAAEGAVVTRDWKWVGLPSPASCPDPSAATLHGPGWAMTIRSSTPVDMIWGPQAPSD